ncbi:NADP-dependent 3-hydroxy acid dehydrogenase YdfG [Bradyrhizobium sp. AZCC 2230]
MGGGCVALSLNIIAELPRRLHEVVDNQAASASKQPAVIDHTNALSFGELKGASIAMAYAIGQPTNVDVNEILIRPTA